MTALFDVAVTGNSDFDSGTVTDRTTAGFAGALGKFGAFVRTRAKTSIRPSRRMRLDELPQDRQQIFEKRLMDAKRTGGKTPVLPFASSKPGEPPRTPTGIYPRTIMFGVEVETLSSVIGPVPMNGAGGRNIPNVLEFGGDAEVGGKRVKIQPRPHMKPALDREVGNMVQLFEGVM